jgi:predicted nucleic acid-binding protein
MSTSDRKNIIVADSDALDRFIKTGNTHVLPALYDRVVVPEQVYRELTRERSPREVREWMSKQRDERTWLRVGADPLRNPDPTKARGWGEKQAIALAHECRRSGNYESVSMLLEDRKAVGRADQQGLQVTRGLFLLDEADRRGLIDPLPEEIKCLEALPIDYRNEKALIDGKMVPLTDVLVERHYQRQEQLGRLDIKSVQGASPDRRDFIASFPSGKQSRFSVGGLTEGEDVRGLLTFHHYERLERQSHSEVLNLKAEGPQYSHTQTETRTETHTETPAQAETHSIKF